MKLKTNVLKGLFTRQKTRADLADFCEVSRTSVQHWINGKNIGLENVLKIASFFGVDPAELSEDVDCPVPLGAINAYVPGEDVPPSYIGVVKEYVLKLSAGDGHEPEWEELKSSTPAWYNISLFHKNYTSPERCKSARVYGDSMIPTLLDGDKVIWIDEPSPMPSCVHIIDGGIYVISIDSSARVKRLRKSKEGIVIYSDNSEIYQPETYSGEDINRLRIYGRVIHVARDL